MPENTDYKNFRDNVPIFGDRLDRVENLLLPGMPDINFCGEGRECWIEQKSPKEPVRPTTPLFGSNHKLSTEQKNWFLRQTQSGGRSFVLITTNKRWILIGGDRADFINSMTVDELISESYWNTLKPIRDKTKWQILRKILISY